MKKASLFIMLFALIAQMAVAQVTLVTPAGYAVDSLLNAENGSLVTPAKALNKIGLSGNYEIGYTIYNDSATTGLTTILQSSLDRVNWKNHFGNVGTDGKLCDSLVVSTTTDSTYHVWHVPANAIRTMYINDSTVYYEHTQAGRTLNFRLLEIHSAGGKTRTKARLITSD